MSEPVDTHAGVHVVARKVYFAVAAALMLLLLATYAVAQADLGPFNIVAALAIAAVKAMLVVLFFMEVRWGNKLLWLVAGASLLWLAILMAGVLDDVATRAHLLPGP